jgi:hypothetical protein
MSQSFLQFLFRWAESFATLGQLCELRAAVQPRHRRRDQFIEASDRECFKAAAVVPPEWLPPRVAQRVRRPSTMAPAPRNCMASISAVDRSSLGVAAAAKCSASRKKWRDAPRQRGNDIKVGFTCHPDGALTAPHLLGEGTTAPSISALAYSAVTPAPTSAGRFGMARTTARSGRHAARSAMHRPAAIDKTTGDRP